MNHAFSHHLDHSGGCIHLHIFYVECRGIGLFILTHVDSFLSAKQNRFHITLKRAGNGQLSIIRFIINKNIGNIFPLSGKASPCQFNIQRIGSGSINGFTVFFHPGTDFLENTDAFRRNGSVGHGAYIKQKVPSAANCIN